MASTNFFKNVEYTNALENIILREQHMSFPDAISKSMTLNNSLNECPTLGNVRVFISHLTNTCNEIVKTTQKHDYGEWEIYDDILTLIEFLQGFEYDITQCI